MIRMRLKRANRPKGWGAKPLAYVPRAWDRVAGLPGEPDIFPVPEPGIGIVFGALLADIPSPPDCPFPGQTTSQITA